MHRTYRVIHEVLPPLREGIPEVEQKNVNILAHLILLDLIILIILGEEYKSRSSSLISQSISRFKSS
jgi:hypothetical protein